MIILSALRPMRGTSDLAKDGNEKRKDLARLYPDARQIWVDSDHGIPLENPESVIEAIREVLSPPQPNVQ
jgi:pimeloyl-ACP methyl ester carboxylesterase